MDNDKAGFGEWIAYARVRLRVTQAELAALVDATPSSVSQWERGQSVPIAIFYDRLTDLAKRRDLMPPPAVDRRRGPVEKEQVKT